MPCLFRCKMHNLTIFMIALYISKMYRTACSNRHDLRKFERVQEEERGGGGRERETSGSKQGIAQTCFYRIFIIDINK